MKFGIISDIHANLEGFIAAVKYFEKNKIDRIIIIGDIIGYGPEPVECINLANEIGQIILKGNHEEGVLKNDFLKFKKYAKISLEWTIKEIGEKIKEIKNWKEKEEYNDIVFFHASISDFFYKYILKINDAEEEFKLLNKKICFIGHTHIPGGFKKNIKTEKTEIILTDFSGRVNLKIEEDFKYIINVGSVGFPRDGLPFSCVSIYDIDKEEFKLERIEYNYEATIKKIIEKNLPSKICSFLKGF